MSTLEQQARAALAAIRRYPVAFVVPLEVEARWAEGVAHVAQALALFAELGTGNTRALEREARLGEAELVVDAAEAADALRDALAALAAPAKRYRRWEAGESLASGEAAGEAGQRLLLEIAETLRQRFERRPEVER